MELIRPQGNISNWAKMKVLIMGESNGGKFPLLRYANKTFTLYCKDGTGRTFEKKELILKDNLVSLEIWESDGLRDWRPLETFKFSHCCILVFDVTNRLSFEKLDFWRQQFFFLVHPSNNYPFHFALVGTKVEVGANRKVSKQEAQKWCEFHSMPYFECSTKDGTNIQLVFETLAEQVLKTKVQLCKQPVYHSQPSCII